MAKLKDTTSPEAKALLKTIPGVKVEMANPIRISIPCHLGSAPAPAGDRHHGHREISLDACLHATLETNN